MPVVLVPAARWPRWVANFGERHGGAQLTVVAGVLAGRAQDGSRFEAALPFGLEHAGAPDDFAGAAEAPADWGVLLVRKGGFAIARMHGDRMAEHKIGQRHVQGRTKAGGQSQQRFARRRDNQARQAYEAAAGHAARLLSGVPLLVVGGDHAAIDAVLPEAGLAEVTVVEPWLPVPDPKRAILDQAIRDASSIRVGVVNA
jgi:hypothetical protein